MGSDLDHPDDGLSASQVEEFIERGYLVLRGCLPAERMRELTRRTLVDKEPMPTYRDRGELRGSIPLAQLDLLDASQWPYSSLSVDTQRALPIAEFAPKLWEALRTLAGQRHYVDRRTMGEQFILNGDYQPPPCPPLTPEYRYEQYWHIDVPSNSTTLEARHDALVLLVLWSKVEPGGGGTLFSGESLTRVVHQLDESPEGIDTMDVDWGRTIARECDDAFEFTGDAGDVLISHAFALHAAHSHYGRELRVLENPTITVRGVLDYSHDNPEPSPVEACVIRRRSARATKSRHPRTAIRTGAQALLRSHPDYFLPGRAGWLARTDGQAQARVLALDAALWSMWTRRVTQQIECRQQGALGSLKVAQAIVREVFVNERHCGARVAESSTDPDFERTAWARLVRGMVNADGQNYALASTLARVFERVELFRLPGKGHVLARVVTPEGWAFVDAWAGSVFFVASMGGEPLPGVPEHAQLQGTGSNGGPRFDPEDYEAGDGQPLVVAARAEPEADLDELVRAIGVKEARTSVWSDFVAARIDQLLGDRASANRRYTKLLPRLKPSTATAKTAELFEQRTGADHYALDF
ncbi:MAG: hypothetical protein AAF799_48085 [Myxococcota bacterium]